MAPIQPPLPLDARSLRPLGADIGRHVGWRARRAPASRPRNPRLACEFAPVARQDDRPGVPARMSVADGSPKRPGPRQSVRVRRDARLPLRWPSATGLLGWLRWAQDVREVTPRMPYSHTLAGTRYTFDELRTLLARATPFRSGDALAGLAAGSAAERVAAQMALADVPLATIIAEPVVPYETDEVTRLIVDTHDNTAFAPIAALTVGEFREFLLAADTAMLT